ncbi:MAG: winged helix-turn-helix domain-containing protein [Candidatus Woesearchaeota archaeon]
MNIDEEKEDERLEEKKTEILRLCSERPSTTEELCDMVDETYTKTMKILSYLEEKGLIKETDNKFMTTKEGEHHISP